jgi:hypothetical protein
MILNLPNLEEQINGENGPQKRDIEIFRPLKIERVQSHPFFDRQEANSLQHTNNEIKIDDFLERSNKKRCRKKSAEF